MEPAQLSFLVEFAPEAPKQPSPWELLAAGLREQKMASGDIEDRLRELNQRKPRT